MPTKLLHTLLFLLLSGTSSCLFSQDQKPTLSKKPQLGLQLNISRVMPSDFLFLYPGTDSNFPLTGVGGEFIFRKPLSKRLSLHTGLGFDYTFKRISRFEIPFYTGAEVVIRAYNYRQYTYALELPVLLDYNYIQKENVSWGIQIGTVFTWISQDVAEQALNSNSTPLLAGTSRTSVRDILYPDLRVGFGWKQREDGLISREIGLHLQWPIEEIINDLSGTFSPSRFLYNSTQLSLQYIWYPAFLNKH